MTNEPVKPTEKTSYKLCGLADLDATNSFGQEINGTEYCAVREQGGEPRVYVNSCPHLGIALEVKEHEFLDMDQAFVICSNHGALFQIDDGLCVFGPCKNQSLTSVAFEIKNQEIWIQI